MSGRLAIVGGGLAGAALAIRAAADGRPVLLLERRAGPHDKVCGEFLSGEAVRHLRGLGLDPLGLGGVPIRSLRLSLGACSVRATLPFEAVGLSRAVLDEALLRRAEAAGAGIRRGVTVRAVDPLPGGGFSLRLDRGGAVRADTVALACGKHELRSHPRPPGRQNDLVGFKQHLRLADADALRDVCLLALFDGGYAGLQPAAADGTAVLCAVVRARRLAALGGGWDGLRAAMLREAPELARALHGAAPVQPRPLSIARIPYGLVSDVRDGLWRLGDQAAVIPSLTGEGMSIALHSAACCAGLLRRGAGPAALSAMLARDLRRQMPLAMLLSHAAVRTPAQRAGVLLARRLPGAVGMLAAATRLPAAALERGLAG